MGFTNTTYTDVVDSFVKSNINIIKNPMYIFNDKKPTIVKYYNKDINLSTLDEVAGIEYDKLGANCPSKFNIIDNALLYGIEKIQLNHELDDEDGIEADDITGDACILPNTFVPYVGDFFEITYLKEGLLFIVTEVKYDTLDNGSNFYKIGYTSFGDSDSIELLNEYNIANTYKMLPSTIGTSMKSVIISTDYDLLVDIEGSALALKEYYKQLFFKNPIQTFSYVHNGFHLYDPYIIEFIMRNKILSGTRDYVYVEHAMNIWETFGIDYDHTFFRALELRDKDKLNKCNTIGVGQIVIDSLSLLTTRIEDYYYIDYRVRNYAPFTSKIEVAPNDLIDDIMNETLKDYKESFYKIIYDYFQDGVQLKKEDLDLLDDIEKNEPKTIFYMIPVLIYILENRARELLEKIDNDE